MGGGVLESFNRLVETPIYISLPRSKTREKGITPISLSLPSHSLLSQIREHSIKENEKEKIYIKKYFFNNFNR